MTTDVRTEDVAPRTPTVVQVSLATVIKLAECSSIGYRWSLLPRGVSYRVFVVQVLFLISFSGVTAITAPHTATASGVARMDRTVLKVNHTGHFGFQFIITRVKTLI